MNYTDIKNKNFKDLDDFPFILDSSDEDPSPSDPIIDLIKNYINDRLYKSIINNIINSESILIVIDYKVLDNYNKSLSNLLINKPDLFLDRFKIAIQHFINLNKNKFILDDRENDIQYKITNIPEEYNFKVKDISVKYRNKLISIEGMVRQYTFLVPKENERFYWCTKCNSRHKIELPDYDIVDCKLKVCPACNSPSLKLLEDDIKYINVQRVRMQESLDNLTSGEIAHSIDLILPECVANSFQVGEKIRFTGILRTRKKDKNSPLLDRYIKCYNVENINQDFEDIEITDEEEIKIKELSKRNDILDMIGDSIAPQIYGYKDIKRAIALQLFGGVEKNRDNSRKRDNIHILIVGDPGLGKTELLLGAKEVSPKSIFVVGKTTTGVGLVGAMVKDDFGDKDWTLRPGALSLANGGFVMIDEFDKMDDQEKSALHESMTQGTVTISKAGVNTTLNSKVSILAAANPKYVEYDSTMNFTKQINVSQSLLSRFDLFYVLKNNLDLEEEKKIAEFIGNYHIGGNDDRDILPKEFLRKYIAYARKNITPKLSKSLIPAITEFYLKVKRGAIEKDINFSRRFSENIIRLAEANAKLRLSNKVTKEDINVAKQMLSDSLKTAAIDVETNNIDVNLVATGISSSLSDRYKKILEFLDGKKVYRGDLLDMCLPEGIDRNEFEHILEDLIDKGDVEEVSAYHYRRVHR